MAHNRAPVCPLPAESVQPGPLCPSFRHTPVPLPPPPLPPHAHSQHRACIGPAGAQPPSPLPASPMPAATRRAQRRGAPPGRAALAASSAAAAALSRLPRARGAPAGGGPLPPLPHAEPLPLSHLLLSFAALAVAAALAKSSPLVAPHAHARVDRVAVLACAAVAAVALHGHVAIAAEAGSLTLWRFVQFFVAGGICAFVTHAACTPIDVVKTRMQTTHQGKYAGLRDGMGRIVAEEGPGALLKGLGATAGGYFLHGAFKYSFYEVFKVLYSPDAATALKPPLFIACAAGFCAECIACCLLCPMEAVRIRSVSDPNFPTGVAPGLAHIARLEGIYGLYKGLPAMLLKQVPYTVGQFAAYEVVCPVVRVIIFAAAGANTMSASPSLVAFVSTVAGLLAGVIAAIISHPGDTILSKVNQDEGEGGPLLQIQRVTRASGFAGLFAGLNVRILQVAAMVAGQFCIYDSVKVFVGLPTASSAVANISAVAAVAAVSSRKTGALAHGVAAGAHVDAAAPLLRTTH